MNRMPASALRYFLAVSQAGTFRHATKLLHVSASAINRQISLLEASLGTLLFERSRGRNKLKLTAAGDILLARANEVINTMDQARSEIEALKGLRTGTVSIGVPEMFVHHFLPDFLKKFSKEHPGISFKVSVDTPNMLTERLLRDEIEFAMIYHPPARSAIQVMFELSRPNCVMVRTDHPLASKKSVRLLDCAPFPLVMPEYGTRARELYDAILAREHIDPTWVVSTTSYEMLRSLARVGLGVAIVSGHLTNEPKSSDSVLIPIRDCPPAVLAGCSRTGRTLSVATSAFVDKLSSSLIRLGKSPRSK